MWADTPFGTIRYLPGDDHVEKVEHLDVVNAEPVTTCHLPGLDEAGVETLVSNILVRGYLEKSGVHGKEDAVLYLLVNEALHTLEEIARKEGI